MVSGSGNAATGLQLELLPTSEALGEPATASLASDCGAADTRVMRSRGFWSMPACPGTFELGLVAGPSAETFSLGGPMLVEVSSFSQPFLPLSVAVRPGSR